VREPSPPLSLLPPPTWHAEARRRAAPHRTRGGGLGFGGSLLTEASCHRSPLAAMLSICGGGGGGGAVAAGEELRGPYPLPPTHPRPRQLGAAIDALLLNPLQGSDLETLPCSLSGRTQFSFD
jgi:hypothetical protein